MAGMLNFSEETRMKVGLIPPGANVRKGWLGWLASPISSSVQAAHPPRGNPMEGKNFADLWIEFLLNAAENERNTSSASVESSVQPQDPPVQQPIIPNGDNSSVQIVNNNQDNTQG